eukprot:228316-Chlamydomonas_euryale.AAC.1
MSLPLSSIAASDALRDADDYMYEDGGEAASAVQPPQLLPALPAAQKAAVNTQTPAVDAAAATAAPGPAALERRGGGERARQEAKQGGSTAAAPSALLPPLVPAGYDDAVLLLLSSAAPPRGSLDAHANAAEGYAAVVPQLARLAVGGTAVGSGAAVGCAGGYTHAVLAPPADGTAPERAFHAAC